MTNTNFPIFSIEDFCHRGTPERTLIFQEIYGPHERDQLRVNEFCLLLFVKAGKGIHIINFIKHELLPGQIHFVFPGTCHAMELEEHAIIQQVLISQDAFRAFINQLKFTYSLYQKYPVISVQKENQELLSHNLQGLQRELSTKNPNNNILIANLAILAELINDETINRLKRRESYGNPVLFEFISLIHIHYRDEKLASFYSNKMNISTNYLNKLCMRYLNQTATSLIQQHIIAEAKKLLYMRNFSVKEISLGLGYTDASYFIRFFKNMTGMTPKSYQSL